jgi:hypothetical protein
MTKLLRSKLCALIVLHGQTSCVILLFLHGTVWSSNGRLRFPLLNLGPPAGVDHDSSMPSGVQHVEQPSGFRAAAAGRALADVNPNAKAGAERSASRKRPLATPSSSSASAARRGDRVQHLPAPCRPQPTPPSFVRAAPELRAACSSHGTGGSDAARVGAAPAGSAVDAIDLTNMSSGSEAELLGDDGLPSPTLNQVCAWACAASLRLCESSSSSASVT